MKAATTPQMVIARLTAGQTTTVLLPGDEGNACKRGLPLPGQRSECGFIHPGRSHRWLTPHPSRSRSNADCRPLLQQSSPNRGQVVQPGKTRKGITSRLTMDAGLIDTPLAPPQVPQEKPQTHTWNVRPQVPTPAASTNHCHWNVDESLTLGLCSGVFGVCTWLQLARAMSLSSHSAPSSPHHPRWAGNFDSPLRQAGSLSHE